MNVFGGILESACLPVHLCQSAGRDIKSHLVTALVIFILIVGFVSLQAFFHGKLKIQGNVGLAMKLKNLKPPAGLVASATPQPKDLGATGFKCAVVFDEIKKELERVMFNN